MNSIARKISSIALFFLFSHCGVVNTPPAIDSYLNLNIQKVNDTTKLIMTTTSPKQHVIYSVADTCELQILRNVSIYEVKTFISIVRGPDGVPTGETSVRTDTIGEQKVQVFSTVFIANEVPAAQSGTFHAVWAIPDSFLTSGLVKIYGCVLDQADHAVCNSLAYEP